MRKLIFLLALLSLVNIASATVDARWEKVDGTFTSPDTTYTYEKYLIYYTADSDANNPNAIEFNITGYTDSTCTQSADNIGVYAIGAGAYHLYAQYDFDRDLRQYTRVDVVGISGLDSNLGTAIYIIGSQETTPVPTTYGFYEASYFMIAIADNTPFETFEPQFATIYLLEGTAAEFELWGGGSGISGGKSLILSDVLTGSTDPGDDPGDDPVDDPDNCSSAGLLLIFGLFFCFNFISMTKKM